jgi:hypothetical protein
MGELVEDSGGELVDDGGTWARLWAGRSSPVAHVVSGAVATAVVRGVIGAAKAARDQPPPGGTPGEAAWAAVVATCAQHPLLAAWPRAVLDAGLQGPPTALAMARQSGACW